MANEPTGADSFETDAERLHLLVDAVTDYAIYMLDRRGCVASWNAGAERLIGYKPDEIIGQHFSRFFTQEDRQHGIPAHILATAASEDRCEVEGWRVRKDGAEFLAVATLHKVQDQAGHHIGFGTVMRDITQQRAAQDALLESERRFRILVQGVTDYAIYMLDPSGIVTNWNVGAEHIKGYAAAEIIGQHVSRFYTWEDRAAGLPARALDTARREGRYESEGWRVRKDGSRFWAAVVIDAVHEPDGALIGFAKVTRDITERRQAQDRLRDSERQFRLLVNGITEYALYMLDLNGIITSWNLGAERIKGYTTAEILGQHFSKFYTQSERLTGLPARALQTAAAEGRYEAEGWRVRKDGSLFRANVVLDPIRDETGKLVGFSKITRDITERHETQRALEEQQTKLAQVQKMEALGQLTGGVAHDFNNLLMVVSGYISTIQDEVAGSPRAAKAAAAIELAAKRGTTLTRQLLSFARRQSLNPTLVHLQGVVETAQPLVSSVLGGSVRLVTTVLTDVWPIRVDASELELAIINLAVNARDAMAQGGTVSVVVENNQLAAADTPAGLVGDFVAITVADTGDGIPPDILAKVFDPFFTTKESGKGTGLGLSQVHGFAHQAGGTVVIASQMGQGTSVTLYLPRGSEEAHMEPAAPTQAVPAAGRRVLLVEDNPDVAEATKELLARMGCQTEIVGSAQAALQVIESGGFDLVLSDIVMAGPINGIGLAKALRERHPEIPIILATGYSEAAAQTETEFNVLRKPYDLAALNEALNAAVERRSHPRTTVVPFNEVKRDRGPRASR